MRLLPAPRLRVRLAPTSGRMATAVYALTVGLLELTGRAAASDLHDLLAACLLLVATVMLLAHHRRDPLPWVGWVGERVRAAGRRLARRRVQVGLDLRGSPPLPDRLPPVVWAVPLLFVAVAAVAELLWTLSPDGWRVLGRVLYTPYLAGLMLLWLALGTLTAVGIAGPLLLLDRRLQARLKPADRRPAVYLAGLAYFLLVAAVSAKLPAFLPLLLAFAVAAGGLVAAARVPAGSPGMLWRRKPGQVVHSVPARRLVAVAVGVAGVGVFALLLTACGGGLLQPVAGGPLPVTAQLGAMAGWLLPGLIAAAVFELSRQRRTDPSRRTPPTLTLHPNGRPDDLPRAVAALRGWRVEVADAVRPGEVGVALVAPERSQATDFDPTWPLAVSVEDLEAGTVRERLARRDEVQLRRNVFRGLAVLLKRASRGQSGGGVWFAPHWWFNAGLMRDRPAGGKPGPPRRVGPPFARVYDVRTLQHLHAVLRAVQLDLIFLEDGVSRKQFDRVLRAIFELYDIHGGQKPAEDRHFLGLPRVRVMVHEYGPGPDGEPAVRFKQKKFDDLTRARVLHVFRDDDGVRAEVEAPFDTSWSPAPTLGMR